MAFKRIITVAMFTLVIGSIIFMEVKYNWVTAFFPVSKERQGKVHDEALEKIRADMLEGKTVIEIKYFGDSKDVSSFATDIMNEAFGIDDPETSDDFDYIRYKFTGANISMRGLGHLFEIIYNVTYLENNEQTKEVNRRVEQVLKELDVENKSEFNKVKLIHDFIIDNCDYDMTSRFNSAYGCLIYHYSACQGYAELTYKMFTEAGLECRIVTGESGDGPHAWNIVKVDGKWYFIDCTWDDPVGGNIPKSARYTYFLRGKMNFKDHMLDGEFSTAEFQQKYPIEFTDYQEF